MKVLIADDSTDKVRHIVQFLISFGFREDEDIDVATSVSGAVQLLKKNEYALLILDLVLPMRLSEDPRHDGGTILLKEIQRRSELYRPEHIIGLTVDAEALSFAEPEFNRGLWSIVKYSNSNHEWTEAIEEKIRYLFARFEKKSASILPSCDALIVCALRTPELSQLRASTGTEWTPIQAPNDPTRYYLTEVLGKDARTIRVIACSPSLMGLTAASSLTTKACMHFKPKIVAMTGICAGREGQIDLGDCLVATTTWDYGSGKFTRDKSTNSQLFQASPYQLPVDAPVYTAAEHVSSEPNFLAEVQSSFKGVTPKTRLKVRLAPMASGAAVQADGDFFTTLAARQDRKIAGIDMEAFAVCWAARETLMPRPLYFVCKGVCDYADSEKSDDIQEYCAYVSARVAIAILQELL